MELIRYHPLYNFSSSHDDVYLLKTADALKLNDKVQPAYLPNSDDDYFYMANMTGRGQITGNFGRSSLKFRTSKMLVGSESECKRLVFDYIHSNLRVRK